MLRINLKLISMLIMLMAVPSMALAEQSADTTTVANDGIDRMAEDFVTASICTVDPTDWHDDILGIGGHAFIRLQCPTFQHDYCFSYEAQNANDEMAEFLKGQLRMGMFAEPTEEYLKTFRRWNVAVHEYALNLPPEAELRLWQIMDEAVAEGQDLQLDLMRRGCTQTLVQFVERALNGEDINYERWSDEYALSRREIVERMMGDYPWIRFSMIDLFVDSDFSEMVSNERKIIAPYQLVEAWTHAKVGERTLLEYKGDIVKAPLREPSETWFTPMVLACLILLFAVACLFIKKPNIGISLIVLQFLIGIMLCWLVAVSNLPGIKGAQLLPLYNPLPLLLWRWRRYWARPYVCLLIIWVVAMLIHPNIYVEPPHYVIAAAISVVLVGKDITSCNIRCCRSRK